MSEQNASNVVILEAEGFEKYADMLDAAGPVGPSTVPILKDIIAQHSWKNNDMRAKYARYRASQGGVPIHNRELPVEGNKINNKLANDYFGEIIDTKVGYMFGIPVITQLDKSMVKGGPEAYDEVITEVIRFKKANNIADLDAEMCKFAAICGYDIGLAYIDKEGKERVMRVDPWQGVIISRAGLTEPQYGVRYFKTWEGNLRVELYDDEYRHTFDSTSDGPGELTHTNSEKHMFKYCPMWGIPNNAELLGDGDKVLSLIDAYDRSMSDMNSEIEQFRLAYMLFFGVEPDEEMVERMRKTGALYVPPSEGGDQHNDIKFLTKQMDHLAVDSHLDRLDENISRFARHVNFTDEAFGGNLSGVAMKYKLFGLETKAKYFERKHDAATLYMWKVIASAWEVKGLVMDWKDITNKYNRNVAINIVDEANSAVALLGVVSRRTALSTLSFIPDVDAELEEIEREKGETGGVDLDDIDDDETDPNNSLEGLEGPAAGGSSVLNGAQVASLLAVIKSVKAGDISTSAAIALITSSFGMTDAQARSILEENNAI